MKKEILLTYDEFTNESDLSEEFQCLIKKAKEASQMSYSPYSNFRVGASVLLHNDEIIIGNNQENAAYPSGLCAERVAIFYANATHPTVPIKAIAIAASNSEGFVREPITPCGSCRQVLLETEIRFGQEITIILYGTERIHIIRNAQDLLPFHFDGAILD